MPVYVYQAADVGKSCGKCRGGFEFTQSMKERPLGKCPDCGAPVIRVIQAAGINTRWRKSLTSGDNLKKHGFRTGTQLLEEGKLKLD